MNEQILINVTPQETRVAVTEQGEKVADLQPVSDVVADAVAREGAFHIRKSQGLFEGYRSEQR